MRNSVGIVEGDVEGGEGHQRRQPGHPGRFRAIAIELREGVLQGGFLEVVADLDGMPGPAESGEGSRHGPHEGEEGLEAFLIRQRARPDPLHAERRLSPAARRGAIGPGHRELHPDAGDVSERLGAELQRNPRFHRQEVVANPGNGDVGRF